MRLANLPFPFSSPITSSSWASASSKSQRHKHDVRVPRLSTANRRRLTHRRRTALVDMHTVPNVQPSFASVSLMDKATAQSATLD